MEGTKIILNQTLMMLIIVFTGVICKNKIISETGNKELSKLVLTVVNPVVILMAYQTDYRPELAKNLLIAFGLSVLAFVIMFSQHIFLIPKEKTVKPLLKDFSSIYSNSGQEFRLINALLGTKGVFYLTAFITIFNIASLDPRRYFSFPAKELPKHYKGFLFTGHTLNCPWYRYVSDTKFPTVAADALAA